MGTSGSRFHDELLRQNILTKKSSFSSPYRSTPANLYSFQDNVAAGAESANYPAAGQESEEVKVSESNTNFPSQQQEETSRLPRDWLAEAEAEAQARRQGKKAQHQQDRRPPPTRARETSNDGPVNMSQFSSPAYRANTVSSQLRRRSAAPAAAVTRAGRARSRSQSRSELDQQQAPRGRASSNSSTTGRSRSAGRVRSHSADALTRLHPQYQQSPHQQQHQQQPWRPLPMPTSPGGPPLVRTTAASRGRTAFITGAPAVNTLDTSSGRSRPRSSSAGSSRSLQGGQRMYSSFSHNELPPAEDFGDVWLADPPVSRFHGKRNPQANGREDEWQAQQEQQRVQDYHSLYDNYPSAEVSQNGNIRQPRIKEGPQAGGAGDSYVDLNHLNSGVSSGGNDDTDDLRLPWSHSTEAHNDNHLQEEYPSRQTAATAATRRGSGRSTSSGRHFAMNLDELLAEMA